MSLTTTKYFSDSSKKEYDTILKCKRCMSYISWGNIPLIRISGVHFLECLRRHLNPGVGNQAFLWEE